MSFDCSVNPEPIVDSVEYVPAWEFVVNDLLCLTAYNEPLHQLQLSLDSVALALHELAKHRLDAAQQFGVCLIFDGVAHASAEALAWLRKLHLLPAIAGAEDLNWHSATLPLRTLSPALEVIAQVAAVPLLIPVWVLVKPTNRGKLNSHANFFDGLCALMQPLNVYQLDVGTTIAPSALIETMHCFERDENIGAISSRCAAVAPSCKDGVISAWQFFDTSHQLSTQWPIECLTGYLSVIPGQFCAFRWSALYQNGNKDSPLRQYLRGADVPSLYERIMFLAEDRVVGQALTLSPAKEWKLEYGVEVQATNDACTSLRELMRQRRRWNNGANACRLHLLWRWREFLRRDDRTAAQKTRFSGAMVWQLLLFVTQVFAPAVFAANIGAIGSAIKIALREGRPLLPMAMGVCVMSGALFWRGIPKLGTRHWAIFRDSLWWIAMLAYVGLLARVVSFKATAFVFGAQFLALHMTAHMYSNHSAVLWRRFPEYLWIDFPMRLMLWAYSLLKLDNTTWGTKGLRGTDAIKIDWRTVWAMPLWIALNITVSYGWHDAPGYFFRDLPLLMELSTLMCSASIVGSLLYFAKRKLTALRIPHAQNDTDKRLAFNSQRTAHHSLKVTAQLPLPPNNCRVHEVRA